MRAKNILTQFDYFLFISILSLAVLGAIGIYSATADTSDSSIFARQLLWIGLGIVVCFLVMTVDYHFLADHAFLFYCCSVLLLLGVLFFGTEINNSRSWFQVAGVRFQPSEIAKLALILALAQYLADLPEDYLRRKQILALTGITLLPVVLIVLQGDLGTAVMYVPILLGIMFVSGLRMKLIIGALLVSLCLAPAGWFFLKDYQRQRILVTFDPQLDPQGIGYQTRQSQIAIGSGGFFGKGWGEGLQSQLGFVPEVHTDFIFALLAEEAGFLGATLILMLYLLVLMRLVRIAEQARDRVGILIVTGITSLLFCHVVINVGMTLGILPPIGIPLPLLSYGGSATLSIFAALGLALNVYQRRFVY